MKEITGSEKEVVVGASYSGDYIQRLKVRNPQYFTKLMNETAAYETADGLYLVMDLAKPNISSTMYYDDEQERPDKTEEQFIAYNLELNLRQTVTENNRYMFYSYAKCGDHPIVSYARRGWDLARDEEVRNITDAEFDQLKAVLDAHKAAYIERLRRYWKRYGDKVSTMGYWANR